MLRGHLKMDPETAFGKFLFGVYDSNSIVSGGNVSAQGAYCPVQCVFCMCDGDTPEIPSGLPFISRKQFEAALAFVDPDPSKPILLGDGMTNFVAEPFAHPQIYEMIETICCRFPEHTVTMITTGILVDPRRLEQLSGYSNLNLSISVNTLQEDWRNRLFPNARSKTVRQLLHSFPDITLQFMNLDGADTLKKDLEETSLIEEQRGRPFKAINVRRIDYSRFHSKDAQELSTISIESYPETIRYLNAFRPDIRYWIPDLTLALGNEPRMEEAYRHLSLTRAFLADKGEESIGMCVSESSYKVWRRWFSDSHHIQVINCPNHTYGGSITVAGLLCFSDISKAVKGSIKGSLDRLLIPGRMLNRAEEDLTGYSKAQFTRDIGLPVDAIGP